MARQKQPPISSPRVSTTGGQSPPRRGNRHAIVLLSAEYHVIGSF